MKLYTAKTILGNIHKEGETTIYWLAFREKPVAPYDTLISNYGAGAISTRHQEIAVNQLLTKSEVVELRLYLSIQKGWEVVYNEVSTPRDFHSPMPICPPEDRVLLFEEPQYNLSVPIFGTSIFKMLPGIPMEKENAAWGLLFLEDLFHKLGIDLSENGIFSFQNLVSIYQEIFNESGLYVQQFGQRDVMAEITPEKHIARIDEIEKLEKLVEEEIRWQKQFGILRLEDQE
ncbi:MAG: hypothetical protein AB1846_13490 [Chloroflexota bacterium]